MIVVPKKVKKKNLSTRQSYLEGLGFECKNWQWSWSFVNHKDRIVAFGAWDYETNGNRSRILSDEWKVHPEKQVVRRGYRQAMEHINLVREEGYGFQLFRQVGTLSADGTARLLGVQPGLSPGRLSFDGKDYFGLWEDGGFNMSERTYGHVDGVQVGAIFPDRISLSQAGIHRATQGGITGGADGAESIVLNAGYVDDVDHGDVVLYTGHGGRDPNTGRQISDQVLERGNLGLAVCHDQGLPVRVSRGSGVEAPYGTEQGYRYDGLYQVEDYWHEIGLDGFRVYRFRLVAIQGESTTFDQEGPRAAEPRNQDIPQGPSERVETTTLRIVRDTRLSRMVKEAHDYRCQVCDVQLSVPSGYYAEAAHVKPLGTGHDGPDIEGNVLCLCPNHHVLFDRGTLWIDADMNVQPNGTPLLRQDICPVDPEYIEYHRNARSC